MRYLILTILLLGCFQFSAQESSVKLGVDITSLKMGTYIGPYRGRTEETKGPFNQGFSILEQVYFPLQLSLGHRKKINTASADTVKTARHKARLMNNEYANNSILLRPSFILHFVDNGAMAYGGGVQISFRTFHQFYLEYQFAVVYLDAKENVSPDLHDGMNLHHFVSISKPLSEHFTGSLGFIHMSKGGFNSPTSNQDVLVLGIKWNL